MRLPTATSAWPSAIPATCCRRATGRPRPAANVNDRLLHPQGGCVDLARRDEHSGRRAASRRGARVHQLHDKPEIAARNSNFIFYANGNLASQEFLDEAVQSDQGDLSGRSYGRQALHDDGGRSAPAAGDHAHLDGSEDRPVSSAFAAACRWRPARCRRRSWGNGPWQRTSSAQCGENSSRGTTRRRNRSSSFAPSPSGSAASSRSTTRRSLSTSASSTRCSAPRAAARPRCSACSPASRSRPRARSGSTGSRSPACRRTSGRST